MDENLNQLDEQMDDKDSEEVEDSDSGCWTKVSDWLKELMWHKWTMKLVYCSMFAEETMVNSSAEYVKETSLFELFLVVLES